MRSRVLAVLLAVITVAVAVWAFWPTEEPADRSSDLGTESLSDAAKKDPRSPRRAQAPSAAELAAKAAAEKPLPKDAKAGRLLIRVTPEAEAREPRLQIAIAPAGPVPARTPDGWLVDDCAPEVYQITITGPDLCPHVASGLRVRAAETTEYTAKLENGVRVAGRIFDAATRTGVPGAEVRFLGDIRVYTDADGKFQVEPILPKTALREIAVRALDYDKAVYRDFPIVDPSDIQVAVGGGGAELVCRFDNGLDLPLPKKMSTKIAISPGVWDVRREGDFEGRDELVFRNLYATDYRVEVRFPDGEHPAILMPFTIAADEKKKELTLPLRKGVELSGKVIGPAEVVRGLRLELVNARAEIIAESKVSEEGRYSFRNLAPGEYIPRLRTGGMPEQMPPITIGSDGPISKDIDVLRHDFVESK